MKLKFAILFLVAVAFALSKNKVANASKQVQVIDVGMFSPIDFDRTKFSIQEIDQMNNEYHQRMLLKDSLWDLKRNQYEVELQNKINEQRINPHIQNVITIPVVFHVVYNTAIQNISDAQILSQITVLNKDFGRMNSDTINTPIPFRTVAANTGIQFCLAQRDPNGDPSTGIERRQTSVSVYSISNINAVKFYTYGGFDQWDPRRYMNIWVCNNNFGAFGEFPTSNTTTTYGVVIPYDWVGDTGTVQNGYDLGRILDHELGHCFNLYHIWGDDNGACTGTDFCNDTPNQADATTGCWTFPHFDACTPIGNGVMFENYMDYTAENCLNIFTQDQSARMNAVLSMPPYNALTTSNGCQPIVQQNDNAGISEIIAPVGYVCVTFTPKIILKNWGSNNLNSCSINYYVDANTPIGYNWNGNLSPFSTDTISFPPINLAIGAHTFAATTNAPNSNSDSNPADDSLLIHFHVQNISVALPLSFGFESPLYFVPTGWSLNNPDNSVKWVRTNSASSSGNSSALINNLNYLNGNGQQDEIVIRPLDLTTAANPVMSFDVAYTYYDQTSPPALFTDTLTILISTDCGYTFSVIYQKGGMQLATVPPIPNGPLFVPNSADWRTENILLANFQTSDNAIIKIRNTSDQGNALYLDNINISDALGINNNIFNSSLSLYPNPTSGQLFVDFGTVSYPKISVKVYDIMGKTILNKISNNFIGGIFELDLSQESNGVYFVEIKTEKELIVRKILLYKI